MGGAKAGAGGGGGEEMRKLGGKRADPGGSLWGFVFSVSVWQDKKTKHTEQQPACFFLFFFRFHWKQPHPSVRLLPFCVIWCV